MSITSSAATRNPDFRSDFDRLCAAADTRKARGQPPSYIEPSRWLKLSDAITCHWEDISIEALIAHFDRVRRRDGAPPTTVEALMLRLRERGLKALTEPEVQRRLSDLNEEQLHSACSRLQRLKPPGLWTSDHVTVLVDAWNLGHAR
jgi:hypothetical protein